LTAPAALEQRIAEYLLQHFHSLERPTLVAIGGPGGVGKSTFASRLGEHLPGARILRLDRYKAPRIFRQTEKVWGPHPKANKMVLLSQHLSLMKRGRHFHAPVYCHQWGDAMTVEMYVPGAFNLLDGEISTYPLFEASIDFSIFIDSSPEAQLKTRLERDVGERGHSRRNALDNFLFSNLIEFLEFGAGTKPLADIRVFRTDEGEFLLEDVDPRHARFFHPERSS
jgi:uridine kinase